MNGVVLALSLRLGVMAVATFLAVVVWSKIRDAAWMLIVVGIIAGYADILYSLLVEFGLAPDGLALGGVPLLSMVFPNLPWIFFSAAFAVMIARRRIGK